MARFVIPVAQGALELFLVGLSHYDGDIEDFVKGLLVLREDLRDPMLRQPGRRMGSDPHPSWAILVRKSRPALPAQAPGSLVRYWCR